MSGHVFDCLVHPDCPASREAQELFDRKAEMPDTQLQGLLKTGTVAGPSCAPGQEHVLVNGVRDQSLYQLLQPFEGKIIRLTIEVLDHGPMRGSERKSLREVLG